MKRDALVGLSVILSGGDTVIPDSRSIPSTSPNRPHPPNDLVPTARTSLVPVVTWPPNPIQPNPTQPSSWSPQNTTHNQPNPLIPSSIAPPSITNRHGLISPFHRPLHFGQRSTALCRLAATVDRRPPLDLATATRLNSHSTLRPRLVLAGQAATATHPSSTHAHTHTLFHLQVRSTRD